MNVDKNDQIVKFDRVTVIIVGAVLLLFLIFALLPQSIWVDISMKFFK